MVQIFSNFLFVSLIHTLTYALVIFSLIIILSHDDKTFSILRKSVGSFLESTSDEEIPLDELIWYTGISLKQERYPKLLEPKTNGFSKSIDVQNVEIKKLADEKKGAQAAQYAAEATLRRVHANQKDEYSVPIDTVIAPVEAEIKMYRNEVQQDSFVK